uniref:Uncharacterized protein n=1 Tax=Ananas comosus var. bracteatus TaxID=296719 RepID=A0A6V7NL48_ANACO|nr:unnamed protein product [Ananas comosus var. bracteatus]
MAMDETLAPDSIRKRLSLQNEVLKWLVEFSEKLEKRAKSTAAELNGLLDEARVVELDMKNTIHSFNCLCHQRFIDHANEDGMPADMKESTRTSVQVQVPAQDYELDILPRYKEALSLGLTSCKNHLKGKDRSTSSIFRAMPIYSPLPHIIGSEEYLHDNSCGLVDDFTSRSLPADFSWVGDSKGVSSDSEVPDIFGSHVLGAQQDSNKDETDPLVSAAQDFKAMLEAALFNPYKFYDEESVLAHDPINDRSAEHRYENVDLGTSKEPEDASSDSLEQPNVIKEHLTYLEDPEVHPDHEQYSALVTGSLFDGEDDSPSLDHQEPSDVPPSISGSLPASEGTADSGVLTAKSSLKVQVLLAIRTK